VIIDTRNPDAYGAGHLPNAVNVHEIFTYLATSTPEGIHELKTKFADAFGKAGLSGKETAVIYEQSMNSGFGQSCRGYYLLTMLGYPKVRVLDGGSTPGPPRACRSPRPCRRRRPLRSTSFRRQQDSDRRQTMLSAVGKSASRCSMSATSMNGSAKAPRLRQGFLPRKGRIPGRLARMVSHDEADGGGAALQVERRDSRGMRNRRYLAEYPGLPLLLQGRAGIEHLPGAQKCRRKGRADVFRLLERMVADPRCDRGGLPTETKLTTGKAA